MRNRVSSQPVGTVFICERCPTQTFPTRELAKDHADETGHTIRPLLEVSGAGS